MGTFSDLLAHCVLFLEDRASLLRGLTFVALKVGLRRFRAAKGCTLLELMNLFQLAGELLSGLVEECEFGERLPDAGHL